MESYEEHYDSMVHAINKYMPGTDMGIVNKAVQYANEKHKFQKRKDGSPYIIHPLAVAEIVAELGLDTDAILGALLHDCIEDTDASHDEIAKLFNPTVAELVEGVTKLTRVEFTTHEQQQMENLRKMFMAMSKDIRVCSSRSPTGFTTCVPCSTRPRRSRSPSVGRPWISTHLWHTVSVCRR